jgi:hypothetical protein
MTTPPDAPLTPTPAVSTPAISTPVTAMPVEVAKRSGGGRWVNVLLGAAAVLAIGGVAFAVGRSTAPANAAVVVPDGGIVIDGGAGSFDPGAGPQVRPGGPGLLGAGGPTLQGTVTALDDHSITIRLANGDELSVSLDDETTYHEATETDATAVAVGDEVLVQADGGRISIGQGDPGQGDPDLTAADVTVRR